MKNLSRDQKKELLTIGASAFFLTLGVGALVRDVISASTGKCTCHSNHNKHSVFAKARRKKYQQELEALE